MTLDLDRLLELGVLSELDLHFARALVRLYPAHDPRVALAAALCSRKVQQGHVCLDLPRLCREERTLAIEGQNLAFDWPELEAWLAALADSPLVSAPAQARPDAPLQLDARGRLYLRRYFEHEQALARAILDRAESRDSGAARKGLGAALDRLFGAAPRARDARQLDLFAATEPDRQREAAERAATRAFCVISGGPGTGKTATVVKILALLVEQALARGAPAPRVLLLAPTGKAAARLSESIRRAKGSLRAAPEVIAQIGEAASTIHRALGAFGVSGPRFRHDRDAPLAADVVVVDEASMIDLALMARLMDAVPAGARVILLGDKDQLASVEAGAVLGDICGAGLAARDADAAPIAQCIALLTRSYRYAEDSGIRKLAEAIHRAEPERALEVLADPELPDVSLVAIEESGPPRALFELAAEAFAPLARAQEPEAALAALERVRVLCAHRRGPFGQLRINSGIEGALRELGVAAGIGERYSGRPLIVTQNDYHARLFNGEVGVLLRDAEGRLLAHFMAEGGAPRAIPLARLPRCETAYALSVHKSQGSEFDDVMLLLPPEPSPLLSRELLYTAITRARKRVIVFGRPEILAYAVRRSVPRASGLRDALWGHSGD